MIYKVTTSLLEKALTPHKENYEKNEVIFKQLAERTAKQEARSEIINQFEAYVIINEWYNNNINQL